MTADTKHRPFKKNIISVLMILMGILVVLSFNTIYTTSVGYAPFVVGLIFLSSILFLLDPVTLISYKSILLLAIYYLVAIILIFVSDFSNFSIFNFILDFPLCLLIVNYLIDKDLMFNFLRSLCNIIFIVACVSLIFWFLSSILKVISPTSSYLINWGGYKKVNSFYNMYFEAQGLSIDGILSNLGTFSNINRNCAIFVEAVMANFIFSIGFILNELIEKNMYKRVVFLIAVLSTFTTSGIVTFCFFTLYLVSNMKSDNRFAFFFKSLIYLIAFILGSYITISLLQNKFSTLSGNVRSIKITSEINAFLNSPILGNGINRYTKGSSNALSAVLADGGILLMGLYYFPLLVYFIRCINKLDSKIWLIVLMFFLLDTTVIQYTNLIYILVGISWNILLIGENKIKMWRRG